MSIRVKFLIVVLIAVMLPTAFAAFVSFQSTIQLARGVAADQRAALMREAEGVLRTVMDKNVGIFQQESTTFITAGLVQASDAARLLADPRPVSTPRFAPAEFRESGTAPALGLSERHAVLREDGTRESATVSFRVPAIYVGPTGSQEDADRLAGLATTFGALSPMMSRSGFWQFVTLDSGVHAVFPGHGLLPDGYDPLQDPVYQRARSRVGQGFGSPPSVDPATGQTLVGLMLPVRAPDGSIIGISGVLSRVDAMLEGLRFGTAWGDAAENLFVVIERNEHREETLYIIAKQSYSEAQDAKGFLGIEEFTTDDPADTAEVMTALRSASTGARIVTIGGTPMLCCFAGLPADRIGLVTLVPTASIGAIADDAAARIRNRATNQLIGVLIGIVVFSGAMLLAAFSGARVVTQPIATLAAAMRRVAGGDLDVRAEVTTRDEVGELAEVFNGMVPRLRDHLRISHSLDLAQQVQRKLLPAGPPDVPGFDIAARSYYCDETGGDYFDFIDFDQPGPGRLTIAVGDVTGHGIAAALLMATARALIRMRTGMPGKLAESLADINRHLAADADTGRFMTLMVVALDRAAGTARWVGAGHDPVLVYDTGTDTFTEWEGEDIPLAVQAGWTFHELTTDTLRPGMVLFLGTDGIWETLNASAQFYGKARLRECIRANAARPANEIADAVVADVKAFRGEHPQLDDITLVVIRVTETA
ncbi:MAG: SpoIIE family protein phosphatase [Phycisphaerales bacterium JB054]